jgi:hypothetical protein
MPIVPRVFLPLLLAGLALVWAWTKSTSAPSGGEVRLLSRVSDAGLLASRSGPGGEAAAIALLERKGARRDENEAIVLRAAAQHGRQVSAVVAAESLHRRLVGADHAPPLGALGAAILAGKSPPDDAWTTRGEAGFCALMAARSARGDLVPAINSALEANPAPADRAAMRWARAWLAGDSPPSP